MSYKFLKLFICLSVISFYFVQCNPADTFEDQIDFFNNDTPALSQSESENFFSTTDYSNNTMSFSINLNSEELEGYASAILQDTNDYLKLDIMQITSDNSTMIVNFIITSNNIDEGELDYRLANVSNQALNGNSIIEVDVNPSDISMDDEFRIYLYYVDTAQGGTGSQESTLLFSQQILPE